MSTETKRTCPECGEKIIGRIDKRFCSDSCRAAYNNHRNRDATNLIRNTNRILRKNHRILKSLNPSGKKTVSRQQLARQGFDFGFFTSLYTTRDGNVYYYCYEQGYRELEKGYFLLVVKQEFTG